MSRTPPQQDMKHAQIWVLEHLKIQVANKQQKTDYDTR